MDKKYDFDATESGENAPVTPPPELMAKANHFGTLDHFMTDDGRVRLVPVPTADPLDPLNMPRWRKWMVVIGLCLYGSIGITAQVAVGAMIPIFLLDYSGLDPKMLNNGSPPAPPPGPHGYRNIDLTKAFPPIPGAPSAQSVSMLASLPQLFIGVSNFIAIPMAEIFGRRPVAVFLSLIAFIMLPWCAKSSGLQSHLAARCLHALGAGAVEALVPLILQDITFIHERNGFMSLFWGSGAVVGMIFGISGTHIITKLSWRWFYWILAIPAGLSFLILFFFLPETKFARTQDALEGRCTDLPVGKLRPDIDHNMHDRKRWGLSMTGWRDWSSGYRSVREFVLILLFPNIVWVILLNSIFIGANIAGSMTGAAVLILPPYSFKMANAGLITISLLIAALFAFLIGGVGGDWAALQLTKRNGGRREPEHQIVNFILPIIGGIIGNVLFGFVGDHPERFHWITFFIAQGLLSYGFLSLNSGVSVYAIECYPQWAGSILVMVTALRNVVSFGMSFAVYDFIDLRGFIGAFGTFAGITAAIGLVGIPVWIYGKQIRARAGRIISKYN